MTGVINEQLQNAANTDEQYNGIVVVNETQTCVSPVYSLPDDDRLYTQAALACKENLLENIESYSSRHNVDEDWCNDNVESQLPEKIIDLSSDEEDNNTFQIVNIVADVRRGISNLSIKDNHLTVITESQSILENFKPVSLPNETCLTKGIYVNSITQNATEDIEVPEQQSYNIVDNFEQNNNQSNKKILEAASIYKLQNNSNDAREKTTSLKQKVKKKIPQGDNAINISKLTDVTKLAVKFAQPLLTNNIQEIIQIPKKNVVKNLNTKKTYKKRNDNNKTNKTKSERKRKTKKDGETTKNSTRKIKKSDTDKPSVINNDNIPTKVNTDIFKKTNSFNANSKIIEAIMPKMDSKNIKDDLSWIENIRYVREITTDEFDSKLSSIEESFWDNLMLPNGWNDEDFFK